MCSRPIPQRLHPCSLYALQSGLMTRWEDRCGPEGGWCVGAHSVAGVCREEGAGLTAGLGRAVGCPLGTRG